MVGDWLRAFMAKAEGEQVAEEASKLQALQVGVDSRDPVSRLRLARYVLPTLGAESSGIHGPRHVVAKLLLEAGFAMTAEAPDSEKSERPADILITAGKDGQVFQELRRGPRKQGTCSTPHERIFRRQTAVQARNSAGDSGIMAGAESV